jgi:hypothetical protein
MVVDHVLEDLAHLRLRVVPARLECLRHLVEQRETLGPLGGEQRDAAAADKGPDLLRWLGECLHTSQYATPFLASATRFIVKDYRFVKDCPAKTGVKSSQLTFRASGRGFSVN